MSGGGGGRGGRVSSSKINELNIVLISQRGEETMGPFFKELGDAPFHRSGQTPTGQLIRTFYGNYVKLFKCGLGRARIITAKTSRVLQKTKLPKDLTGTTCNFTSLGLFTKEVKLQVVSSLF